MKRNRRKGMKTMKIPIVLISIAALGGCTMVKNEDWKRLNQDISDLKRENQDLNKAKESLGLRAEESKIALEEIKKHLDEIEKKAGVQLSSKISATEKALSETEKKLRKNQADVAADMTSIRSDFQVLTGRFEETKYAVQKGLQEEKASKEEANRRHKDVFQTLEDLQKRIAAIEQSLLLLRQGKEAGKEKPAEAPSLEDAYKDAYETYQKGDYASAREKFKKYLEAYPGTKYSENAMYWIGESHYSEKEYEKAIVEFDDVGKKYPDGTKAPAALLKQGMAFSALGDKKSANAIFKKLTEKYPKSEQADVARKKLKE